MRFGRFNDNKVMKKQLLVNLAFLLLFGSCMYINPENETKCNPVLLKKIFGISYGDSIRFRRNSLDILLAKEIAIIDSLERIPKNKNSEINKKISEKMEQYNSIMQEIENCVVGCNEIKETY
jgi:thermostable 8-oxoguanine DNA glycosylase